MKKKSRAQLYTLILFKTKNIRMHFLNIRLPANERYFTLAASRYYLYFGPYCPNINMLRFFQFGNISIKLIEITILFTLYWTISYKCLRRIFYQYWSKIDKLSTTQVYFMPMHSIFEQYLSKI